MLPKDKQLIYKLKRRISFLIIIVFSLSYWIRINYYDLDWKTTEVESLEKDSEIRYLKSKLDSIKASTFVTKIEKPKNIINTKKKESKPKTDTVKIDEDNLETYPQYGVNEIEIQTNDSTKN
jgi:hypothetical protein